MGGGPGRAASAVRGARTVTHRPPPARLEQLSADCAAPACRAPQLHRRAADRKGMVEQNVTPPLSVFGWAQDMNGCGNYRIGMPMWALQHRGHDATAFYGPDAQIDPRTDVVVGQLMYDENRARQFREIASWPGRRPVLVYEIDDDIWNIHASNTP